MNQPIELAEGWSAHNYHPLPLVVAEAEGALVTDIHGRRYLDMVAAYSAMNFGHRHPRLLQAARTQLERVTLTSRAIYHDRFGPFCKALGVRRFARVERTADNFSVTWWDRFPGGCVTYRLHSTADVDGRFTAELPRCSGLRAARNFARRSGNAPTAGCSWTPGSTMSRSACGGRWARSDEVAVMVDRSQSAATYDRLLAQALSLDPPRCRRWKLLVSPGSGQVPRLSRAPAGCITVRPPRP